MLLKVLNLGFRFYDVRQLAKKVLYVSRRARRDLDKIHLNPKARVLVFIIRISRKFSRIRTPKVIGSYYRVLKSMYPSLLLCQKIVRCSWFAVFENDLGHVFH